MPLLDLTNQPADLCWQSHADILGPTAVDETITPNFNYQPRPLAHLPNKPKKRLNGVASANT